MRLNQFINEATTGHGAWVKYFQGGDVNTYVKKTAPIWRDGKKTDEVIEAGEEIIVPAYSEFKKGKIDVLYNTVLTTIQFANIDKQAKTGGETLKIPANVLTKTAQNIKSTVGSKTFDSKVFYNATDLSITLVNSIQNIKTVPDELKDILIRYLESGKYSTIDWMYYDNKKHINEIAKYLGEIMIGLCVLNGETNVLSKNVFKGKPRSFIMPTDASFVGIDSMFDMKDHFVPISSKSGKGAPASFNANVMPVLVNSKVKSRSKLLSYMIDIQTKRNLKNLEFVYEVGMNYIMGKELSKTTLGRSIMKSPYGIYTNIRKGIFTEREDLVIDIVRNGKWPKPNTKKLLDKLPNSLTYFICNNIAELLNKDTNARNDIINALAAKEFWQANLDKKQFHNGNVKFKMISSGSNDIKMAQGKGTMNSVTSEQGRLSYFIS